MRKQQPLLLLKIGREADGGCPAWIARHMIVFVIEFEEALPMDVMFMATYSAKDDKDQKIKSKVKVPAGKRKLFLNWNRHIKILLTVWVSVQQKAGVVKLKSLNLKEKK